LDAVFFFDFQIPELPDLVHTKVTPDCLKVAPTGEHGSPFFIEAAFKGANPNRVIGALKIRAAIKPTA
jgi:hypothetical protein